MSKYPVIEVKDFGPIARGKVELRPLTVFAGPSNTGKSWLATLLYAMRHGEHRVRAGAVFARSLEKLLKEANLPRFPAAPAAWIESIDKGVPIEYTAAERKFLELAAKQRAFALADEIQRCFGLTDSDDLIRRGAPGGATIKSKPSADDAGLQYAYRLSFDKEYSCSITPPTKFELPLNSPGHPRWTRDMLIRYLRRLAELQVGQEHERRVERQAERERRVGERDSYFGYSASLWSLGELLDILWELAQGDESSTWYLPADRGGIMHAHHTIVSSIIQGASRAGLRHQQSIPTLSGVLADFLDNLVGLIRNDSYIRHPRRGKTNGHAERFEQEVIGGSIEIDPSQKYYPRFLWRPRGWDKSLSLMSASSMVTELAPVALYLKYRVRQGDLLIFEEPEAHLHPTKQVDLMNEIAGWIRAGIRVVLTTHSEWVLEAMANLVAEAEGKGRPNGLSKEQIGVWQFEDKGGKGTHIREIVWDKNEGGFETDFYDVAASLHNGWVRLIEGRE